MKPTSLTIHLPLLIFLTSSQVYCGYGQADQGSARNDCRFEPSKAEDLTTDPEMIRAWNQMDLQIAKLAQEFGVRKTSRSKM